MIHTSPHDRIKTITTSLSKYYTLISYQKLPTMLTIASDPEAAYEGMLQDVYY